jgi:putative transcriptional regulator
VVYAGIPIRYSADVTHIGAAIRAKRKPQMTQGEFAARLGLTQPSVSAWERGDSMPTADTLPKIARILGCSVDDLVIGLDPQYDAARMNYPVIPSVNTGVTNAGDVLNSYAPAIPRGADVGPANRQIEPATIPQHLAAPDAAAYLNDIARELGEHIAARIRSVSQALLAREFESPAHVAAGERGADRHDHHPHARRRRTDRRRA